MKEVDMDLNGHIDYMEFLIACMNKKEVLTAKNIENTFNKFDKDKSGGVTSQELFEILFNISFTICL